MVVKSPQTPRSPQAARSLRFPSCPCASLGGQLLMWLAPSVGAEPPFTPAQPTSQAAGPLQTLQVKLRDVLPSSVLP